MQTYNSGKLPENAKCAVALGNFDGVHKGHAALIEKTVDTAHKNGLLACVYTFEKHPSNFKNGFSGLITDNEEKEEILRGMGVDILYFDDFEKVKNFSCSEFCEKILAGTLHAELAVCGKNYRFGKNRSGDSETLTLEAGKLGVQALVIDYVTECGKTVNSTEIRQAIVCGNVEKAADMLGRPFSISYPVIHGRQLGRQLGFPTINQQFPENKIKPENGVYACLCTVGNSKYPGVANVGTKPTVTDGEKNPPVLCETHIIGYNGDLYDKNVKVDFYRRLREEKKFSNLAELTDAVRQNIEETKKLFQKV